MGRRHVVRDLDDEQFTFVIEAIINGFTDREISAAFQERFEQPLAKSSLGRWRESAGNELAEKYRLARYQAKQLLSDLEQEDADKYQVILENIEDHLLTATRKVISEDPFKLLQIRQEEEKRRLKEREIALKEKQFALDIEKRKGEQVDIESLPQQIVEDLFTFIGSDEASLKWFRAHAKGLETFLSQKYGSEAHT